MENGKSFVIEAPKNSDKNIYVKAALLNGKPYAKNWLNHFEMLKGGSFTIDMSETPNLTKGIRPEDEPYSFSKDEK
ncbi:Glycosyl hydrolase family 92 [compost metagenome]